MSSSTPGSKRRRVDQAQSALHKPFRSPLKTAQNGNNNDAPSSTLESIGKAGTPASSIPKTPARSKAAAGQTPRNALYKPFTPSTLAKASLPGSSPAKPHANEGAEEDENEEPGQTQETLLKRQRLNQSPNINAPLRSLSQQTSTSHSTNTSSQTPEAEVMHSTKTAIHASPFKAPPHPPTLPSRTPSRPILKTAIKAGTITPGSFLLSPSQSSTDPEIAALEASIRDLERQTRVLRNQIDVLRTAEGLPSQNSESKDGSSKLETLLAKWRNVSQEAAETVFADVSTRFKDAGGMRGYKRTQRTRQREQEMEDLAWESANSFSASAASSAEEKEALEEIKQQREMEDREMVDEEEEFTMEIMLGMLHIEAGVIGWDGGRQGWV
ncbi:hypothetical protein BDV97DRAFT_355590 [Delphinella strobiligena]|nr:hypothetical protein BDV97DRAFT_355590 [Delphinella strobiligena]